jgi:DNA-binding NtrC family response regulator
MDSQVFLGRSLAVCELVADARSIARSDATVLITGPHGAGKTQLARLIHDRSGRHGQPIVPIFCSGVQESLFEQELFGGMDVDDDGARGLIEVGNGGTVVLDEVSDLSVRLQTRLLHFLEERADSPAGARRLPVERPRIISTTSCDLYDRTLRKEFSELLFYRLNVVHLIVPGLDERRDDIPLLSEHFAHAVSEQHSIPAAELTLEALSVLQAHDWPGHVRELKTVVERIVLRHSGARVSASDVVAYLAARPHRPPTPAPARFDRFIVTVPQYLGGVHGRASGN